MQKIINVLALASTVVSVTVVGVSGYVYLNREAIIEDIKEKALGGLGGSLGGDLPIGAPDLAAPDNAATAPQGASMGLPVPSSAFQ